MTGYTSNMRPALLVRYNLVQLLLVSILPFPTRLLAEYIREAVR